MNSRRVSKWFLVAAVATLGLGACSGADVGGLGPQAGPGSASTACEGFPTCTTQPADTIPSTPDEPTE